MIKCVLGVFGSNAVNYPVNYIMFLFVIRVSLSARRHCHDERRAKVATLPMTKIEIDERLEEPPPDDPEDGDVAQVRLHNVQERGIVEPSTPLLHIRHEVSEVG